jgi:hypothetical protein
VVDDLIVEKILPIQMFEYNKTGMVSIDAGDYFKNKSGMNTRKTIKRSDSHELHKLNKSKLDSDSRKIIK